MATNFDINNLNDFIQSAKSTLLCDSACQKRKQSEQLKQDYLNAVTNLKTAKNQLDTSEKNYITFTQGASGYSQAQNNKYSENANKIVSSFKTNFDNQVTQIQNKITTYSGLLNNYNNVYELYARHTDENKELKSELNNSHSDVNTNDRKTYYENQEIERLNYIYKYVLWPIYILTVVVYCIAAFLYSSAFNWKIRLAIAVFLIVLPFVSTFLLSLLVKGAYMIYGVLPKNVYLNL
jgi:hypothetical protein